MIGEERTCARDGCDETFVNKAHNQKYHSQECTKLATNARIMGKYWSRKDQLSGKVRYCVVCKTTRLSRYNDTQVCRGCEAKEENRSNEDVAAMISGISWQD